MYGQMQRTWTFFGRTGICTVLSVSSLLMIDFTKFLNSDGFCGSVRVRALVPLFPSYACHRVYSTGRFKFHDS